MQPYAHHYHPARFSPEKAAIAKAAVNNLLDWHSAVAEIHTWPEYSPQPLHTLPHTAQMLGLGNLFYKDESQRFGRSLGSFKALGAPYAVSLLLADAVHLKTGTRPTSTQLREGTFNDITSRVTVCVATDGNQGRGLAYAAKIFGCRCVIYIHDHVSPGRKEAMEQLGAIVIRVNGQYETSVQRAKEDARMNGWHFVSSTSWDDYQTPLSRNVMRGYMVMIEEALQQLPNPAAITHVFTHGGVGSIAAAIYLGFHQQGHTPRFVMVEPNEADCLYQSAIAGAPTPSSGTLRTLMAGLACREVSPAAWSILDWLTSDFLRIPDSWAADAMRSLANGHGDTPIVCGESCGGAMGVLLESTRHQQLRTSLGLDNNSQVLIFGCEGATDPDIYQQIVGRHPDAVFATQP
jgi:diaminopropionate ammonia-lyase